MEEKKPQLVFWRPEIIDLGEAIIPVRVRQHLECLEYMSEAHVPCIIFTPAGIGVSCDRIALVHCEEAIMLVVRHKPESALNDKIHFDLPELIMERPQQLEAMILKSPAIFMSALERLMSDDCLEQSIVIPFTAQEHFSYETFIDLKTIHTKIKRPVKPLSKMLNSQSRQNFKHFIRKK
jgi:hypothetical protein